MTEARFSYTTKIAGDLFTIRGDTYTEFSDNVNEVLDKAQDIAERLAQVAALGAATALVSVPQDNVIRPDVPQWQQPAAPPAPAVQPNAAAGHVCKHGEPAVYRSGTSKNTGKPWAGYFCARDRNNQCDYKVWV